MNISGLINEFLEQNIQSEAEVSSKLIMPLLELLGYPKKFISQEFPVYGYAGREELHAKAADFLLFSSEEFDAHRGKSSEELTWVNKHSLLVFESKKPTEEITVKGQPVFYSAWTKAIAYVISNGKTIEGYLVNANYCDSCVFACLVEEIPENWEIINILSYKNILQKKNDAVYDTKWEKFDVFENYRNMMRVRCAEELYASVDRQFDKLFGGGKL